MVGLRSNLERVMNKFRFRTREEMREAWKEHWAVAPTWKSYNIVESILCSVMLMALVVGLGFTFKTDVTLGTMSMGSFFTAHLAIFLHKWSKKND